MSEMSEMNDGADGESLEAALVDVLSKENATLKDEVAHLESELERRVRALNDKYAALERDRDNVERIMREASQSAEQFARDLKVVLDREEMRIKFQRDRADMWQAAAADALAQLKASREAK